MKKIALLGSTGSIGRSTLAVARHLKEEIQVVALAAHSNIDLLEEQIREFSPELVAVFDEAGARELQRRLPKQRIGVGMDGLLEVATLPSVQFVVSAIVGTRGLLPTMAAIKAGKDIGLANKETLVSGGQLVMEAVAQYGVQLLPIDSEHSALFQCLKGEEKRAVRRLILTASGGPFRTYSTEQLQKVTLKDALAHPTWNMGAKITVDSSTLFNKGLEVIEAHWLFSIPPDQIDVVVHPQSIIHSMVEWVDGSILAQMGEPQMLVPIQYALTYPRRLPGLMKPFPFDQAMQLQFFPVDLQKFRCLYLALEALRSGGSLPCYMNAANEVLVNRFIKGELVWTAIGERLERLMTQHKIEKELSLDKILAIDALAREEAQQV